jgi:hypothetical protein
MRANDPPPPAAACHRSRELRKRPERVRRGRDADPTVPATFGCVFARPADEHRPVHRHGRARARDPSAIPAPRFAAGDNDPVVLPPRVRSHCRFRNKDTEYVRGSSIEWMSGGAKRQCDRALFPPSQTVRRAEHTDLATVRHRVVNVRVVHDVRVRVGPA